MNLKFTFMIVILLAAALLLSGFEGPPNRDRPVNQFVGTETCKTIDEGTLVNWDTQKMRSDARLSCVDKTNDPLTTGKVDLKLVRMWFNPNNNNTGFGWFTYTLTAGKVTWNGYRIGRISQAGVTFTNGWGYAHGQMMGGQMVYYRFTDATPSVIHGWYEQR